ncbi:hypothetical protein SNE40_012475 [Patella caerulea]|uniref:Uncharacterized protein n=1 Tax=Patella caerulea TaxID=87958 RepID=A0AAN8JRN9_PATCE
MLSNPVVMFVCLVVLTVVSVSAVPRHVFTCFKSLKRCRNWCGGYDQSPDGAGYYCDDYCRIIKRKQFGSCEVQANTAACPNRINVPYAYQCRCSDEPPSPRSNAASSESGSNSKSGSDSNSKSASGSNSKSSSGSNSKSGSNSNSNSSSSEDENERICFSTRKSCEAWCGGYDESPFGAGYYCNEYCQFVEGRPGGRCIYYGHTRTCPNRIGTPYAYQCACY